jgi:hypothetical protein
VRTPRAATRQRARSLAGHAISSQAASTPAATRSRTPSAAALLNPQARPLLAKQYLGEFDLGLISARALFAKRRMEKSTFLERDLIPAAKQAGYITPYLNLWTRMISTPETSDSKSPMRTPPTTPIDRHLMSRCQPNRYALTEQTAKESEGAIPCLLGPDGIVLGLGNTVRANGSLIGKRVVREIAMKVIRDFRCA